MRYQKLLLYNTPGCFAWAGVFIALGYVAGESWRMTAEWAGVTSSIVGSGLVLAVALVWLWRWRRRHEAEVKRR
ncbi:MAG: DedA family protein [Desulfuromonadales bacterium]